MHKRLLLTLGHNASAILVHDDKIVCGYEEERLSGVKSDSRFPINAINRCMQLNGSDQVSEIYATHWDPMGDIDRLKTKYWDRSQLPKHGQLFTNNTEISHHDCHAASALWYANGDRCFTSEPTLVIVCDGFGNFGEHLSIYRVDKNLDEPKLVKRVFGYDTSLGLMYQYMTAFLGMKMHEDEYKLLGYEAHISDVDVDREALDRIIKTHAGQWIHQMFSGRKLISARDPLVSLDALPGVQADFIDRWLKVAQVLQIAKEDLQGYRSRVIFAYYAQHLLEEVMKAVYLGFRHYAHKNLVVAGGVFYNVKLNMKLTELVMGQFCAFPLAGDQGNAIGLAQIVNKDSITWPGHFNWGVRPKTSLDRKYIGFWDLPDGPDGWDLIAAALEKHEKVNVVRGAMEFGPRALCNTSTLAYPRTWVVEKINEANGRNTVMPMAPVMHQSEYLSRFRLTEKVHMSEQHMIMALPYHFGKEMDVQGAAHFYEDGTVTGRPQVISTADNLMYQLLSETEGHVLINTSFNVHGHPIVYDLEQALANHMKQLEVDPSTTTMYLKEQL